MEWGTVLTSPPPCDHTMVCPSPTGEFEDPAGEGRKHHGAAAPKHPTAPLKAGSPPRFHLPVSCPGQLQCFAWSLHPISTV